jgi:hypothetical protein
MAFRTQSSRVSNPAEARRIFQGEKEKYPQHAFISEGEVKLWVPCRKIYGHVKDPPECYVEVGHLQAKFTGPFLAHIVTIFGC